MSSSTQQLIDPDLLKGLSEDQKQEALQAAAAAKRAEERAEQRALERAIKRKEEERMRERQLELERNGSNNGNNKGIGSTKQAPPAVPDGGGGVVFIPKRKRAKLQEEEADFAREKGYSKHSPPKPLYTVQDAEQVRGEHAVAVAREPK